MSEAVQNIPQEKEPSSFRLIATLAALAAGAGLERHLAPGPLAEHFGVLLDQVAGRPRQVGQPGVLGRLIPGHGIRQFEDDVAIADLRRFRTAGGGSIVNVASIAAQVSMPGQAVYSMTKAGLVSLTRSFAKECGGQGIRVNAILPGLIETRFASALVDDPKVQKWVAGLPAGRTGQPEDMVAGVLYLVSDGAAYTTGAALVMDGGATLG